MPPLLRTDDEYYTPKHVWETISNYIPKDMVLWEAFKGNGQSARYLTEIGHQVVTDDDDFFTCAPKGDMVVSNPPFSKAREVLERLVELDKPFILILPASKIGTRYVRQLFADNAKELKFIIPPRRINFDKPGLVRSNCSFDCFYWCWKNPVMKTAPNVVFV